MYLVSEFPKCRFILPNRLFSLNRIVFRFLSFCKSSCFFIMKNICLHVSKAIFICLLLLLSFSFIPFNRYMFFCPSLDMIFPKLCKIFVYIVVFQFDFDFRVPQKFGYGCLWLLNRLDIVFVKDSSYCLCRAFYVCGDSVVFVTVVFNSLDFDL